MIGATTTFLTAAESKIDADDLGDIECRHILKYRERSLST